MISADELTSIFERITKNQQTKDDIDVLRQLLSSDGQNSYQIGKYVINLRQGQDIWIADHIYKGVDAEAINQIFRSIITELKAPTQIPLPLAIFDAQELKVSPKGEEKAKTAMKNKSLNPDNLAKLVNVSPTEIQCFLNQQLIEREKFIMICQQLNLDWQQIVDYIDELVKVTKQQAYSHIKERCGKMRVLDMEYPIGLSDIYTNVNILQKILGRRRLGITELFENSGLEDFERIGLTDVKEKRVPGLKAVEIYNKLMILGRPGAGKTTFLKYLAIQCNQGKFQSKNVPIFITLKDFAETKNRPTLLEYINQQFEGYQIEHFHIANILLERGRGLVLLDGLDEVREKDHDRVLQEIRNLSLNFSACKFIITCRIAAREYTFEQFTEVEIADFDWQQIVDFVTKWFEIKLDTVKAHKFIQKLEENKPIRELATSPLLLTLLCLIFEESIDFPSNRSELYKEGLDVLLKKWDAKRNIERDYVYKDLSLKRKQDLLSQIAFSTFTQGEYFFKQQILEQQITDYIRNFPDASTDAKDLQLDSEAVIKSIEAQHGLLVERARGIYSFSHLTFQEYFTAQKIITSPSPSLQEQALRNLVTNVSEKRWREVFLITVGMSNNAEYIIKLMKDQIDVMLKREYTLQQFLEWVDQKSKSVQSNYKKTAVRAFYFAIGYTIGSNVKLVHELEFAREKAINTTNDITNAIARDFLYFLDRAITNIIIISQQLALYLDISLSIILDPRISQNTLLTYDMALAFNNELRNNLEELKDQLPINKENQIRNLSLWWQTNGRDIIEKLIVIISSYPKIIIDWEFSETQHQQLKHYYEANKLLVDCLNSSDCYVSKEVREEILNTLLLPLN